MQNPFDCERVFVILFLVICLMFFIYLVKGDFVNPVLNH